MVARLLQSLCSKCSRECFVSKVFSFVARTSRRNYFVSKVMWMALTSPEEYSFFVMCCIQKPSSQAELYWIMRMFSSSLSESKTATECEGKGLSQSKWGVGAFQVKLHELRLAQYLSN